MKRYIKKKFQQSIKLFWQSKVGAVIQKRAPEECFHLNEHCAPKSVFIGILVAFIPIPMQMPLAAILALKFRTNLFLTVSLVWISNPLTIPFVWGIPTWVGYTLVEFYIPSIIIDYPWAALPAITMTSCLSAGLILAIIGKITVQYYYRYLRIR